MTKHEPMTVREALRIERLYASHGCAGDKDVRDLERARAILDALVEAHEARCVLDDGESFREFESDWNRWETLQNKLRALERGEDVL